MFIIINAEEKYKAGRGRGKPSVLERMTRKVSQVSVSKDLKKLGYFG